MPSLIDFHTHFFSRSFFLALAKAATPSDDPNAAALRVANSMGVELPSEDDLEHLRKWLDQMERHGVGQMVSFASAPEEIGVLARVAEASEGRVIAFTVANPTRPDCAEKIDDLISKNSFRGVVLFPAMHGYSIDGSETEDLFHVLNKHHATAVVHCGMLKIPLRDRFGLARGYDLSKGNPLHVVPVADKHASARFVIPHFGGGLFREALIAGTQCENVYVDTSSSNSWRNTQPVKLELADVFERALGAFGVGRILFGTDSSVFPRGWRHEIFLAQREALGACGLDGAEKARILGENAAHVLRIRSQTEAVRSPV